MDLSTDGSVRLIWNAQEDQFLAAHSTWSKNFGTYLPQHLTSVNDILKAFVTAEPVDFNYLTMDAITRSIGEELPQSLNDQFGELLANAFKSRTRNVASKNKPIPTSNWMTLQRVIQVQRHEQ